MKILKEDYNTVNDFFCKALRKKNKKSVCTRCDIEPIALIRKADFICNIIKSLEAEYIICRILFWEKNEKIESFLQKHIPGNEYVVYKHYNNRMTPGICFVHASKDMIPFLRVLLANHFNFELAKAPSLSVRVQICINTKYLGFLLDVYDDRGFFMHILKNKYTILA